MALMTQVSVYVPVEECVDTLWATRWTVSRPGQKCQTACKPGSVRPRCRRRDGHSSGTRIAARLARPTRAAGRERPCVTHPEMRRRPPLFGLAPGGVYPAAPVARGAVRSCRTVSPLPGALRKPGGLFSVALSLGSPPPAVNRHRVPVEPGLSSIAASAPRDSDGNSGRPAVWPGRPARRNARRQAACSTPRSRCRVCRSATPLTSSGRQCRWNARSRTGSSPGP